MSAVASRDGREVVRALEALPLRSRSIVSRGRYVIKGNDAE